MQHLTGDFLDASASLSKALQIFRDLGDQANIAEVLNYMGELALASANVDDARNHFEEALAIAASITTQPEEARALEGIGLCHLQSSHLAQAADFLRRALVIYQRIGSLAAANRVQEILDDRELSGIE